MSEATLRPRSTRCRYKETTREQWQAAAEAWNRWGPALERWLGPATEVMLDLAGVATGVAGARRRRRRRRTDARRSRGASGPTVGCSPPTSRRQSSTSPRPTPAAGFTNVASPRDGRRASRGRARHVRRGHQPRRPDLLPGSAAGPGRHPAGAAPGGRLAAIVYSTPGAEPVLLHAGLGDPRAWRSCRRPPPGQPGRSASARRASPSRRSTDAGFVDVVAVRIDAPLRMSSAAECVRFEQESFGALHQMLAGLDAAGSRPTSGPRSPTRLAAFETADGFAGPASWSSSRAPRPGKVSQMTTTVAAVQATPVFLDPDATTDKACGLIKEAAASGAQLIVFPETFIPTYPDWVWRLPAWSDGRVRRAALRRGRHGAGPGHRTARRRGARGRRLRRDRRQRARRRHALQHAALPRARRRPSPAGTAS